MYALSIALFSSLFASASASGFFPEERLLKKNKKGGKKTDKTDYSHFEVESSISSSVANGPKQNLIAFGEPMNLESVLTHASTNMLCEEGNMVCQLMIEQSVDLGHDGNTLPEKEGEKEMAQQVIDMREGVREQLGLNIYDSHSTVNQVANMIGADGRRKLMKKFGRGLQNFENETETTILVSDILVSDSSIAPLAALTFALLGFVFLGPEDCSGDPDFSFLNNIVDTLFTGYIYNNSILEFGEVYSLPFKWMNIVANYLVVPIIREVMQLAICTLVNTICFIETYDASTTGCSELPSYCKSNQ